MKQDGCSFVTFNNTSLIPGRYRLFYISEYKDSLLGMSDVFQVSILLRFNLFRIYIYLMKIAKSRWLRAVFLRVYT
jgi:hypothetical protein